MVLVVFNLGHTEPKEYVTFDDEYYAPRSIAARELNTTTREEYTPRWVERRPPYIAVPLRGVTSLVALLEQREETARQEYRVRSAAPTAVEASTFFYPGWRIAVDGVPATVTVVPVRGTMRFELPAGDHRVVLDLAPTRTRRAGLLVSIASAMAAAAVAVFSYPTRSQSVR